MTERRIEDRRWLLGCAMCKHQNNIWISSMSYNGLYCYDIETGKSVFIGTFPKEKNDAWRLHAKAIVVEREICFVPNKSKYIHFFNMDTKEIVAVEVGEKEIVGANNAVEHYGHILFLGGAGKIYDVDVREKSLVIIELSTELRHTEFCSDMVIYDNSIYWANKRNEMILEFIIETKQIKVWDCKTNGNGFGTIAYGDGGFWLTTDSGVCKWSKREGLEKFSEAYPTKFGMKVLEGNDICSIEGFVDLKNCGEKPFAFSHFSSGSLWLFPFRTNMVLKVDVKTGEISEVYMENENEDEVSLHLKDRITHCHYFVGSSADSFVFISTKTKSVYEWEISAEGVKSQNYIIWVEKIEHIDDGFVMLEGPDGALLEFIDFIVSK